MSESSFFKFENSLKQKNIHAKYIPVVAAVADEVNNEEDIALGFVFVIVAGEPVGCTGAVVATAGVAWGCGVVPASWGDVGGISYFCSWSR